MSTAITITCVVSDEAADETHESGLTAAAYERLDDMLMSVLGAEDVVVKLVSS